MTVSPCAEEFDVMYRAGLARVFPELFFDWHAEGDTVCIGIQSWSGTSSLTRVGYPLDVGHMYAAARRHLESDAARERVSDSLVTAVVGRYDRPGAGHMPYILRWLAVARQADVRLSEHLDVHPDVHPDIRPAVASPSVALVVTPSRRLQLWADGTSVLHYDRPHPTTAPPRESTSLDIRHLMLSDFQAMWLPGDRTSVVAEVATVLDGLPASSREATALRLLCGYDAGMWLHHHRFVDAVLQPQGNGPVDWARINRLSTMNTEATVQDRAVLAVACHLSDEVTPTISLPDALHLVGAARPTVLEALDGLTGRHPDPHTRWPTDCTACP